MLNEEYGKLIAEINTLPSGGVTYKKINGKKYAYYQWREEGKQRSRRIKDDELAVLETQIERRKVLLNQVEGMEIGIDKTVESAHTFRCAVRIGQELNRFVEPVSKWVKRECYKRLQDYVYGDIHGRVYILYGLRRTGKTTLIRQVIYEMDAAMRSKTVFIQMQDRKSLDDVNQDLKYLESKGYRYVFIDEVTLLDDFIGGAALFSDVFAASGMKIVLSGTDSLGFMFTEDEELYDRCILSHTTFISYHEFEEVLGVVGIDDYIRYGGTMSVGGRHYNDDSLIFATKKSTDEYVDSAIARNIQHSLKNYQHEDHFRSLRELYEKKELTNAINRIVEDINHTAKSKLPERAALVLDCLKGFPEVNNLVVGGIEGTHYIMTEDGYRKEGPDVANYNWGVWAWGITGKDSPALYNEDPSQNKFGEICESKEYAPLASSFTFDKTNVEAELAVIDGIVGEYDQSFNLGLFGSDTEAKYNEMVKRLEEAGIDKIMEECKAHYEAFCAGRQ